MTSGASIGALLRMALEAGARRTNDRTTEPFFSEPYEEKWEPFSPMRNTAALATICPAACAPNPPIDSKRISKNFEPPGNALARVMRVLQ